MKSILHLRWVQKTIHLILVCAMILPTFNQIMPVVQAESGEVQPRDESALLLSVGTSDPVGLNTLPAGSLLQFAGYDWVVLNPSEGLLMKNTPYGSETPFSTSSYSGSPYSPNTIGNVGYILNHDFYDFLAEADQARIQTQTWEIGSQYDPGFQIVDCKVGLLNTWDYSNYTYYEIDEQNTVNLLNPWFDDGWLSTTHAADQEGGWVYGISGNYYADSNGTTTVETVGTVGHMLYPVIALSPNTPTLSGAVIPPQNEILSLSVPNQIGESSFDYATSTITFTVTDLISLTSIVPQITLSPGATSLPANGVAADLSIPTTCTVTSADGFEKVWVLVAQVLSTNTDIREFSVSEMMLVSEENYATINRDRHTVHFLVPADTDITQLTPFVFAGMGEATLSPLSGTPQDFTSPVTYRVTAEAGNTQDWLVTCVRVGDSVPYNVEHYHQDLVGLSYTLNNTQTLSGTLGSTVTASAQSSSGFVENTTQTNRIASGVTLLDGSLTLRLYYDRTLHSVTYEEDGGSTVADLSSLRYGSQLTTPETPVKTGYRFLGWFTDVDRIQAASFPTTLTANTTFYAKWEYSSGEPGDITGFTVRNQISSQIIHDDWYYGIDLVMPAGTDLQYLAPIITTATGTTISPASGEIRDFVGSDQYALEYRANYGGENERIWYVRVSLEEEPMEIKTFSVPGQLGDSTINPTDHTVQFVMPYGSEVTALSPTVTVPAGYFVYSGFVWDWDKNYYSPTASEDEDFSNPINFQIIRSDSLEQTWTASCIVQPETAGYVSSFTVTGQVGNSFLDMVNHKVVFHMPYGTDATNLQPTITVPTGSSLQPLAESVRDYSGLVYFNVTAPGGSPQLWTVQCIVDLNTEKDITGVTLEYNKGVVIDSAQHTITIRMPAETNITSLAPQFQLPAGAEIYPFSGVTKDFTSPRQYLVYAQDGTSQLWTVSVILLGNVNVEHYQMMPAGDWYGEYQINSYYDKLPGSTFTAESAGYVGFVENTTHASRIPSGTVQAGQTLTLKLYYDRLPYTVQFVENGGIEIADLTNVLYGTCPTRPEPPVKAGYRLENWYTDPELTTAYQFNLDITQNLVLYAKWEVASPVLSPAGGMYAPGITVTANMDSYYTTDGSDPRTEAGIFLEAGESITINQSTLIKSCSKYAGEFSPVQDTAYEINTAKNIVSFESNYGSSVASQEIAYGHSATLPETPTQYGYAFVHWCSDFWLSQPYDFASVVQEDITLYAKWVIGTYTISFDTQGGSTIEPMTAWFGTYLTAPTPPTKAGYTFKQWNPVFSEYMAMPGEDTTLTAEWTSNLYSLHFNTAGGSVVADQPQMWNEPITAPADPTRTGYTFAGWSPAIPDVMPMSDYTVTAQWTVKQYTITFDSAGGTAVSPITQDYGTSITQPSYPTKAGYTFNGWSSVLPATMPAENLNITAFWKADSITLHFATGEGTAIADIVQDCGTVLSLPTAPTRTGYAFVGWEPALPDLVPTANQTYVAQWSINSYTITFNVAGGTTVANITRPYDRALSAPTPPTKSGYTFQGWVPQFPFRMPAENQTLVAQWQINQYTLNFDSAGGTVIAALKQDFGSSISAPNNPTKAGYTFNGWSSAVPATMPAENRMLTAQWIANSITLQFATGEGTAIADLVQDCGTTLVAPTEPTRTGYTFTGWSPTLPSTIPTADQTFTAQWSINTYTLSFITVGGSEIANIVQIYNTPLTEPNAPTRTGYTFIGWSPDFPEVMPATNFTLTAQWSKNTYTITFDSNGGSLVASQTVGYGDPIILPDVPTKTGYNFGGWQPTLPSTMPAYPLEVLAYWGANLYTITFDTDGGTVIAPLARDVEAPITPPTDPSKLGYTFKGWSPKFPTAMPAVNTTLTAQWQVNQYTLSFDSAGGTAIAALKQDFGSSISAPNIPIKAGYTFNGWLPALPDTMPAEDKTLTAQWIANAITLRFETGEGTIIADIVQDCGTTLIAPAEPTRTGYTFTGWSPALPEKIPTSSQTYTAQWSINTYKISFDSQGGSSLGDIVKPYNTALTTPTAPTKVGYTFQDWSPKFPSVMPATDLTLKAQWQINQYTLSFDTAGGTTIAALKQDYGSSITRPADPTKVGYTFDGWGSDVPATMPAENQTLTALWKADSIVLHFATGEGTIVADIIQDCDTPLTAPADPTRTGYTFNGWDKIIPSKMPTADQTYVAQWQINYYTVTFDSKGGSESDAITQEYLKTIAMPNPPAKNGHTFTGWYTNVETTVLYDFSTPITDNRTLYAGWQIQSYAVTFKNWEGAILSEESVVYNTAANPPVVPDREPTAQYYFEFYGWNSGWNDDPNQILRDTVFTAVFSATIRSYTVHYLYNNGTEITTQTIAYDDWAWSPTTPLKEGLTFMGWFRESTLLNQVEFPLQIQGDINFYASFKRPDKEILSFQVEGQVGTTQINRESNYLSLTVPWHTDRTKLTPIITVSPGAQVSPSSGVITNLRYPQDYIVTAEDGSQKYWSVTVNEDLSPNEIESFMVAGQNGESIIDPVARTVIFHLPFGTDITAVRPELTVTYGASYNVSWFNHYDIGGFEPVDFTYQVQYIVITYSPEYQYSYSQDWTITCIIDPNTANDFLSFTVENQVGNSDINATEHTILFHMPYGTNATNLQPQWTLSANATISLGDNQIDYSQPVSITVKSESGAEQVWQITCIVDLNRANDILQFAVTNQVGSSQIDAENHTVVFHMLYNTDVTSLSPVILISEKAMISPASTNARDFSLPQIYEVTSQSLEVQNWTVTCVVDPNRENKIINFVVPGQIGQTLWDESQSAYVFHVPYGTNIQQLTPALAISAGAGVFPTSGTPLDFSQAQTYTVTAQGGEVQAWTVQCVVDPNKANDILTFNIDRQVGESVIDANLHTVLFHMPYGTDITTLSPTFTLSERASCDIASGATRDFTQPVTYGILSDNKELQNWTVTCFVNPNTENRILSFIIPGQAGSSVINVLAHTVTLSVPYGTPISDMIPAMTVSAEATQNPAIGAAVDLKQPFIYTVTSQSGTAQTWTVTCNILPNTEKQIEQFTVSGQIGDTVIDQVNHTIRFEMPFTSAVTALIPTLIISAEARVSPASGDAVDFTQPQTFTVTAQEGSSQAYTVTCIRRNTANDILSFSVPQQVGESEIRLQDHTVLFYLPEGTSVRALTPQITVSPSATLQPPTGRVQDFSLPVVYTVTAENGIPQPWTVRYSIIYEPEEPILPPPPPPKPPETNQPAKVIEEKLTPLKILFVQVSTNSASEISQISATISGSIANGGDTTLQAGFRYRQSSESEWQYTGNQSLSPGSSAFSTTLSGLLPGTEYLVEARASNGLGMGEGGAVSFKTLSAAKPKVETDSVTLKEPGKVVLQGFVVDNGGSPLIDSGFEWGTSLKTLQRLSLGVVKSFAATLTDIAPASRLYVRSYATNAIGTGLGNTLIYQVPGVVVATLEVKELTRQGATLQGRLDGKATVLEAGFALTPGGNVKAALPDAQGFFEVKLQDLKPETTYNVMAYVKTNLGDFRGELVEFRPINDFPVVETQEATEIQTLKAQVGGFILKNNGFPITESGFFWGSDPNPGQKIMLNTDDDQRTLQYQFMGLKANTTYYYKAYATNQKGTGFGKTLEFTTAKPVKALVTTKSVSFDTNSMQWVLVGNVVNQSGSPLVEHGFRLSGNQTDWIPITVGFDTQGDFITRGVPLLQELPSGTYYLQAYALNAAGLAEGEGLSFTVPKLPTVKAELTKPEMDATLLTLSGQISDTGGEGIACLQVQFKVRLKGSSTWEVVSPQTGSFAAGELTASLQNLTPGADYEYMAEARNSFGWGSSSVTLFTMNYGKSDVIAAQYLKEKGKSATEIANILKSMYQHTVEQSFALLQTVGFTVSQAAGALKTSAFAADYSLVTDLLKKAGLDVLAVTDVLTEHFKNELIRSNSSRDISEGVLKHLKAKGFTLLELTQVCAAKLLLTPKQCRNSLLTGQMYDSQMAIYESIAQVYGLEKLVELIYSYWSGSYISQWQRLGEFANAMKIAGKQSAVQTAEIIRRLLPNLDAVSMASSLKSANYTTSEVGVALQQIYGSDLRLLANYLQNAGFNRESINDYLIQELKISAVEMVGILTSVYKNWKDPKEASILVLRNYYKLNAVESAKVMYAAGWTEKASDETGYGMGQLVTAMRLHFGISTNIQLIEILKPLGISPYEVAKRLDRREGWLTAYRNGGYTAADAATWFKEDYAYNGRKTQIAQTIKLCYVAQYPISEIAEALIVHYDLDIVEALALFAEYTKLDAQLLKEALTKAYGKDPLQSAIEKMKGQPVETILASLKRTYNIADPVEATLLLLKSNYDQDLVFEKIIFVYFEVGSRELFETFVQYVKAVDPQATLADALFAVNKRYNGDTQPKNIVYTMRARYKYSMAEIAEVLKSDLQLSLGETIEAFRDNYGANEEIYYPIIMQVYKLDLSSYIAYQRNRGLTVARNTRDLVTIFKKTDIVEIAQILVHGGFDKTAVIQGIMEQFYSGFLSPEAVATMAVLDQKVFKQDLNEKLKTLTQNGTLKPLSSVIATLHAAGISLNDIVRTLKDLYASSQEEALAALKVAGIASYLEVTTAVQEVYGGDFVVIMIRLWRSKPWGSAEYCLRELERSSGITNRSVLYRYLRMGGFADEEAAVALYWVAREEMLVTLKEVYNLQSALELVQKLKELTGDLTSRFYSTNLANYFVSLFPQTTNYEIVQAFLAIGMTVPQEGGDSITGWLRSYANTGKRDVRLASYLGKNNNGLNMEVHTAVEILQKLGYNVQDTTYYALKCGFTWSQFFKYLVHRYAPKDFPTSYYDNNSSSKFVVGYLKPYYSILDIAEGLFGYHQSSNRVLADLISAGLSVEEATYATLWQGGEAAAGMVVGLVSNSIGRANTANDQSLRLNAVQATEIVFYNSLAVAYDRKVAGLPYNDPITLEDIAKSLVRYGPGAQSGWESQYFNHWEMLTAMQNITGKYLALAKVDMPVTEIALATMRLAGLSVSDAAAMMAAHKVGLSTSSIIMSVFGLGNDWFEAVKILAGSGYSFGDSISAVYNNSSYHMVIGVSILSSLVTTAVSKLSSVASLSTYINYVKQAAVLGFMIGQNASISDILLHLPNFYLGFAGRLAYAGGRVGYTYIPGAP